MNGPVGYNVRYRKGPGYGVAVLRVSPSTTVVARQVFEALVDAGMRQVEIWRSGKLVFYSTDGRTPLVNERDAHVERAIRDEQDAQWAAEGL